MIIIIVISILLSLCLLKSKEKFHGDIEKGPFATTYNAFWHRPELTFGRKEHVVLYKGDVTTYVTDEPPRSNRTKRCKQLECPIDYGDLVNCWFCRNIA